MLAYKQFSSEDKALTKNLHQFKENTNGILEDKLHKGRTETLLKKRFGKLEATTKGTRATN